MCVPDDEVCATYPIVDVLEPEQDITISDPDPVYRLEIRTGAGSSSAEAELEAVNG
jgi:hypothetical protein